MNWHESNLLQDRLLNLLCSIWTHCSEKFCQRSQLAEAVQLDSRLGYRQPQIIQVHSHRPRDVGVSFGLIRGVVTYHFLSHVDVFWQRSATGCLWLCRDVLKTGRSDQHALLNFSAGKGVSAYFVQPSCLLTSRGCRLLLLLPWTKYLKVEVLDGLLWHLFLYLFSQHTNLASTEKLSVQKEGSFNHKHDGKLWAITNYR